MSFIGEPGPWWIVTYATLNAGRLIAFRRASLFRPPMYCGGARSNALTSPVFSAWKRASLSEIGLTMTLSSFGFTPQYFEFLTSSSFWPIVHELNLNGPVPVGC